MIGLNDVSWELQPGITGLVGHNGAGKSTLIKLLTGQLQPSLGSVTVCGKRAWSAAAKRHLGYCPDVDAFYEEMSGQAFVRMIARLHGFSPARSPRADQGRAGASRHGRCAPIGHWRRTPRGCGSGSSSPRRWYTILT